MTHRLDSRKPDAAMHKLDAQQSRLLDQLDALNESRTAMDFGQLPRNIDEGTLRAVQAIVQVGILVAACAPCHCQLGRGDHGGRSCGRRKRSEGTRGGVRVAHRQRAC